jgi:hypothetical protein
MSMFKFENGATVKDSVTGIRGMIVGRTDWRFGCKRYIVQPIELQEGKPLDPVNFDEQQLVLIKQSSDSNPVEAGGDRPSPMRSASPTRR